MNLQLLRRHAATKEIIIQKKYGNEEKAMGFYEMRIYPSVCSEKLMNVLLRCFDIYGCVHFKESLRSSEQIIKMQRLATNKCSEAVIKVANTSELGNR